MKDIDYFLSEEDRYNQKSHEDTVYWIDVEESGEFDRLCFLRQKPFHRHYRGIDYVRNLTSGYELNDAELTVLGMFIIQHSRYFRDDYYNKPIPEIATCMFEVLDSLVAKAPLFDNKVLYRYCHEYDKSDMEVGDKMFIPHNLTCAAAPWSISKCNIYVIQPLPQNKTRAHDLFKMYPHNPNEKQVNFLRGTSFLVTDIKVIKGTVYHEFYLKELEKSD